MCVWGEAECWLWGAFRLRLDLECSERSLPGVGTSTRTPDAEVAHLHLSMSRRCRNAATLNPKRGQGPISDASTELTLSMTEL